MSISGAIGTVHPLAVDRLPPNGPNTTRFVLLSDTHAHTFPVPDGDVLLHAGDLTERGSVKELKVTIDWLCSLPHRYKIIIAGNHDYCLDKDTLKEYMLDRGDNMYQAAAELVTSSKAKEAGLIYLEDSMVEIPLPTSPNDSASTSSTSSDRASRQTWRIWGSPWSAAFCSMAFNIPRGESSADLYSQIPDTTDILLTHGPPLGMLDKIKHGNRHVGCDKLQARLMNGLPNLKLHVWGHIHEDRGVIVDKDGFFGAEQLGFSPGNRGEGKKREGTIFVNAANAGTFERPRRLWGEGKYQPMVVDLQNDA